MGQTRVKLSNIYRTHTEDIAIFDPLIDMENNRLPTFGKVNKGISIKKIVCHKVSDG